MTTKAEALYRASRTLLGREGVEATRMFGGDAIRTVGKIVGFVGTDGDVTSGEVAWTPLLAEAEAYVRSLAG